MRSLQPLVAAASLAALSGCGVTAGRLSPGANPSLYSVHQPVVQRAQYVLDVGTYGALLPGEDVRLRAWLDALRIGEADQIVVHTPDLEAQAAITRLVAEYGIAPGTVIAVNDGNAAQGVARVVVSRTTASVPGCPDWSNARVPGAPISTDSNFGCATNASLAAMIADPEDLVRGRVGTSETVAAAKPVTTYRDRILTGVAAISGGGDAGGQPQESGN